MEVGRSLGLGALGDLDEVVAELSLHRAEHLADLALEDDFVELADHLTGPELAQRSAFLRLSRVAPRIADIYVRSL